jgi:hypothetical protein
MSRNTGGTLGPVRRSALTSAAWATGHGQRRVGGGLRLDASAPLPDNNVGHSGTLPADEGAGARFGHRRCGLS